MLYCMSAMPSKLVSLLGVVHVFIGTRKYSGVLLVDTTVNVVPRLLT